MSALQSFCLQYTVSGQLDGVTPAPAFRNTATDQGPPLADPENIYRFEIAGNLGVIDLAEISDMVLSPPTTIGNRYITWFQFSSRVGALGPAGSAVRPCAYLTSQVVPDALNPEFVGLINDGQTYSRKGFIIPQGQALQLVRLQDPGLDPYVIRFQVFTPQTQEEEALINQAFCCTASILDVFTAFVP